VTINLLIINY